ncbi:MAG: hypothetical protein WCJ30_23110 [Deltaproteobacteria bacterium]
MHAARAIGRVALVATLLVGCRERLEARPHVAMRVDLRDVGDVSAVGPTLHDSGSAGVRRPVPDAGAGIGPDPSRLEAFCAAQAESNRRLFESAQRHARCAHADDPAVRSAIALCVFTAHGAWSVELRAMRAIETDGGPAQCEGTWSPVFTSGDGAVASAGEGSLGFAWHLGGPEGSVVAGDLRAADLDGDGAPEALVHPRALDTRARASADPYWTVLTVHRGAVVPFTPTADIAIVDVDSDRGDPTAVPDLVTPGPYAAWWTDDDGQRHLALGPLLLAHTLGDGTFAMDDARARGFARRSCPRRTRHQVVVARAAPPDGGSTWMALALDAAPGLDLESTARHVVCARIWGARRASFSPRP